MKKFSLLICLLVGCASVSRAPIDDDYAKARADYCFTTMQGIEFSAYAMDCPDRESVEREVRNVFSRVGAQENLIVGMKITFIPTPIKECNGPPKPNYQFNGCTHWDSAVVYYREDNLWATYLTMGHELGHLMENKLYNIFSIHEDKNLEAVFEMVGVDFYLLKHSPYDGLFKAAIGQ